MDEKKSTYEDKILEVLSDDIPPEAYEMSSEFKECLRKRMIQALHDPADADEEDDQLMDENESNEKEHEEAIERYFSGTDHPYDHASRERKQIHIVPEADYTHGWLYSRSTPGQHQSDNEKRGTNRLKPQWKAMLSLAAVFVFLICGTLLTKGSLREAISNPGINNPNGTGIDDLDIIDTSELINPEGKTSGISEFFQDMWLFVKASLPYLGGAAVIILIIVMVRKRRNPNR